MELAYKEDLFFILSASMDKEDLEKLNLKLIILNYESRRI